LIHHLILPDLADSQLLFATLIASPFLIQPDQWLLLDLLAQWLLLDL
jgi:hypothetical protein